MSTPYKDFELSIIQMLSLKILPLFRFNVFMSKKTIKTLQYCGFMHKYHDYKHNIVSYKRTIKGDMYVRYKRRDFLRYIVPITISTLSLLKSYDIYSSKYLEKILQGLLELLQKIL